jgi:hypothetical protein
MRRIIGCAVVMLVATTGVLAGLADYPADLSKWVPSQPPKEDDERWFAANHGTDHEWVVFLRGDRPSVRLRSAKREKGSPDPDIPELHPPMPFKVEQGFADEGLAGRQFSVQVSGGWIIGFNAGEFGAGLWWFSPDGKKRHKISEDQVEGFFKTDAGLLAIEGLAHLNISRGRIVRLSKGEGGLWHSEHFVDLKGAPETAVMGANGNMMVATSDRLLRVHVGTKKIDVILENAFWRGLHPNSMILAPSGAVYLGMRYGVAVFEKMGSNYKVKWLTPKPESDRTPPEVLKNDR